MMELLNGASGRAHSHPKLSTNDKLVNISNLDNNPHTNLLLLFIHAGLNMNMLIYM